MKDYLTPEERGLICAKLVQEEELESLRGWYPVVAANDGLWWRFFGEKRFREPFFYDTVSCLPQPRLCMRTAYDAPDRLDGTLAPTAFIFHISRCGSTLLTQLLASLPDCVVMSEPPVVDSFLRRYYAGMVQGEAGQTLRRIISALGQRRFAEERHLFVKLDSWHIASLPLFRNAFPDTPFLFLYREPHEVLASHRRQRGRQMVPGLVDGAMPPLEFTAAEPGDLDGHCVNMLESFFGAARRHADELLFVNYRQLPQLLWDDLLDFFAVSPAPSHLEAMKSSAGLHSKNGTQFLGDPPASASGASAPCAAIAPYYRQLERLRQEQGPFRAGEG